MQTDRQTDRQTVELKEIFFTNNGKKINYNTAISEGMQRYFTDKPYFLEYEESINDVPKAILAIPWISNVLPIIWLSNAELILDELDKNFYNSIEEIKKGFLIKYPHLSLNGKITVRKIVDCSFQQNSMHKSISLCSGGVDAAATAIHYIDKNPILVTIKGLDIPNEEIEGFDTLYTQIKTFGKALNLKSTFISSGFKSNIDPGPLGWDLAHKWGHYTEDWWSDIQHGISVISHTFPLAYKYGIINSYIAADYCSKQDDLVPTASWPSINDAMKYGSGSVLTTMFELDRVDRLKLINDFVLKNDTVKGCIKLHVCWTTITGTNCCKCEKCLKTMMGMKSIDMPFEEFGFFEYPNMYIDIYKHIKNDTFISYNSFQWIDIQDSFNNNRKKWRKNSDVNWILDFNFKKQDKINIYNKQRSEKRQHLKNAIEQFLFKVKKKIKNIWNKYR